MPTPYQELRDAIVKNIPDIETFRVPCQCKDHGTCPFGDHARVGRTVTLSDVLRSVPTRKVKILWSNMAPNRLLGFSDFQKIYYWDLTKNLDDQSPECKAFLHSIICSK